MSDLHQFLYGMVSLYVGMSLQAWSGAPGKHDALSYFIFACFMGMCAAWLP